MSCVPRRRLGGDAVVDPMRLIEEDDMTRKRYTVGTPTVEDYAPGRAVVPVEDDRPVSASPLDLSTDDLVWSVYGHLRWLTEEWTKNIETRLDAIERDTYDTADRVDHLAVLAIVSVLMVAALGAIVITLRYLG